MGEALRVVPFTSDCRESALQLGLPEQGGSTDVETCDLSLHITSGSGPAERARRPEILRLEAREICGVHACAHLGSPRAGVERGSSGSGTRLRRSRNGRVDVSHPSTVLQ